MIKWTSNHNVYQSETTSHSFPVSKFENYPINYILEKYLFESSFEKWDPKIFKWQFTMPHRKSSDNIASLMIINCFTKEDIWFININHLSQKYLIAFENFLQTFYIIFRGPTKHQYIISKRRWVGIIPPLWAVIGISLPLSRLRWTKRLRKSFAMQKSKGDRGSPWWTPLLHWQCPSGVPLIKIDNLAKEKISLIQ